MNSITIHAPATTANLGPGFDCLGLALDLWNQVTFSLEGEGVRVRIQGEGSAMLPPDERNLVARAAMRLYQSVGATLPRGLLIECENRIPMSSGLGSSSAAIIAGLVGANHLLGSPACAEELLRLATALDGHPDNVAATLMGGLTLAATTGEGVLVRRIDVGALVVAVAVPAIHLPTSVSRAALPREVPMSDAVFNISRTAFVVQALQQGSLELLSKVMEDRLHQPYRMGLIPGGLEAIAAAKRAGAPAVALSGAGPSIIAFCSAEGNHQQAQVIANCMTEAFSQAGVPARGLVLDLSCKGSYVAGV
jgi:homoserine kinase